MASISDVFNALNQLKGKLDTLHTDNLNSDLKLDSIAQAISDLDAMVDARLHVALHKQYVALKLLEHLTKQQDTALCWLEKIARSACDLVNLADRLHQDTAEIREQGRITTDVLQSAYPDAALSLERRDELRKQIEECCPPKAKEPPCRFVPCEKPSELQVDVEQPHEPIG